ncbi:TasA family protein [Paraconexibacter sp.]|uniref:TasA family protein n=1 Tax=Paraconexibacter sp. TaxID=2949640 RepID=UPI003569A9A9
MPRNNRRTVAALATVLASVGVAVGSGASFSSQTANPANTFSSGTLVQSNSKNGLAIVTGANMKPGDVKTGEVTITNTGTLGGTFVLSEKNAVNGFTSGSMTLKIDDLTANKSVYSGDLGKVATSGIALGDFAPNEAHTYKFTVKLESSAPNADQGKSATADYQWDATVTP